MRFNHLSTWILTAVAASMLLAASSVRAITYGFVDTSNVFSNVGSFIVREPGGKIFPLCTGTLIAPDVFLTASHCTSYFENVLAPSGYTAFVTFDNPIPFGDSTSGSTNLIPVNQVVTNPDFNQRQNDPKDVAVLLVTASDTLGITPATLPTAGLLDQLSAQNGLKDAVFTPVGYGLQNRVTGGGPPFYQDLNPVPRMYAFSSFNALNGGFVRLSQNPATGNGGTCFGDSGGPNFLNVSSTRILAAITVTGDAVCRSTNAPYRMDTDSARQFLSSYVTLP